MNEIKEYTNKMFEDIKYIEQIKMVVSCLKSIIIN